MKESRRNRLSRYQTVWKSITLANRYILSVNKKLYVYRGISELIFPVVSLVFATATAKVTDIIVAQQKDRIGQMLIGICLIFVCDFLQKNLAYILEAFAQMAEMDIQEACKTDLIRAWKEKSLTEIEDPDNMDAFSLHMSSSIYAVSSSGLVFIHILSAFFSIVTAILSCVINKVNPIYIIGFMLLYSFLVLPFIIKIESKLKQVSNDSYHRLSKVDRRLDKVDALFRNKDSIFDIKRRKIKSSLLEKYTTLHNDKVEAHIVEDRHQRKYVDLLSCISHSYTVFVHVLIYLLVIFSRITYGGAVMLIVCIAEFSQSIRNFVVELRCLDESNFLSNEFFDFIHPQKTPAEASCGGMEQITLKDVSYQYKAYSGSDQYQLSNVNLEIKKGEKVAIVGKKGAGKTTLVKLLMGLYTPVSGECRINGIRYSQMDQNDILRLFSVAAQETVIYPMSLKENITISDANRPKEDLYHTVCDSTGIRKIQESHGSDEVLLREEVFEDAVDLSGGEKQKVKLARALYADREILVFDEPLSSLDVSSETDFIDLIFNRYQDRTVIVITHNLTCTRLCDKIVSMENGQISEIGSHKQLMKNKGLYHQLYTAQAERYQDIQHE